MPEKYLATIMKKTQVGENNYLYTVEAITAGDIDEETQQLVTTTGNKYKRIDDFTDFDENTKYYTNIIEVEKITDLFDNQYGFTESVQEYEKRCRQVVYYASKHPDGGFILISIDKGPYINAMETIKSNPEAYENGTNQLLNCDGTESDEDAYIEYLRNITKNIVDEKYSPDELIDLKYYLAEHQDELEATLESIDVYLETIEAQIEKISGAETIEKTSQPSQESPKTAQQSTESEVEIININDVFNNVTKILVAQDQPARRMIIELSRLDKMRKKDYGILLTGQSGAGKSLLMRLIGRNLNRPVLYIDSTQLTAPGFVGLSIEEKLWELYEECGRDIKKAERAIVFFDEIDKKGSDKKTDVSGQAVLNMLLKFLDGTKYIASKNLQRQTEDTTVIIDTSNMIVVGGGAFLDVYEQKKSNPLGFATTSNKKSEDLIINPTMTDFIERAMMPKEFMGRVPVIIHLNNLDVDSLRKILLDSKDSALKLQEEVFAEEGVKLTTKDGYIVAIAEKALEEKIGARGLNKLITDTTWQAYDQVISNPGVYEEVILTEDTVSDEKSFQLVKKQAKKKSS